MKKSKAIFWMFLFFGIVCFGQNPSCSNGLVYMDGGGWIRVYDPSQPLSATNPSNTNIPSSGGGGLALMPNISGGTLTPTFYSVVNGNYSYWNGASWVSTGHSTGNASAVNIAGCNGTLYNLVGATGQVYSYNGSGGGSLLTTLNGFNGSGPYDLVTDCNCNFYALNTSTPNQGLSMYSPNGALQCTYVLNGMPNATAGGGFAIIGNMIYVKNNSNPGFYIGTISGGSVTFTAVTGFNGSPGDFASCPVCYPTTNLQGVTLSNGGGVIGCSNPSVNLWVNTVASPVTFSWSGPGIVGSATNSLIAANAAGIYSCIITLGTCPPAQVTLTTSVSSTIVPVSAVLTPSGNVCAEANSITKLSVSHSSTTDIVVWNGPGIPAISGTDSLNVSNPGAYTVTVTDPLSGCSNSDVVTVHQTPTVNLAVSDNTLCLYGHNGSPSSVTLTPSGAATYTLITSTNFSTSAPNGPVMPVFPVTIFGNLSAPASATLIGSNGTCSDSTEAFFTIIHNPTLTLSQNQVNLCPNQSMPVFVNGASQYTWTGGPGLNTYFGNNVQVAPQVPSVYSVIGDYSGCYSTIETLSVSILPIPIVTITPNSSTICLGSSLTLTVSGTANLFTWTPTVGITPGVNGATVNVSPPQTLVYTVVGSLNSCTSSATSSVYIVQPPPLSLSLSSPSICSQNYHGSPNTITVNPSGAVSYTLEAGANINVNAPNGPVMQVSPTGTTILGPSVETLTLIGKSGVCTVSETRTFMIVPNPVIAVSPPSASVCPGNSQLFSVSGASTYTWLPMPGYTITSNTSIVANPTLTSFYSVLGSAQGCRSEVKNAVLVLLPVPEFSLAPETTTVCAGNSVTLSVVGNADTYTWAPAASLSANSGSQVIATPSALENYTVVGSLNTCTNMAVVNVSVIVIPVISASASNPTICSSASTQLFVTGADSFMWFPSANLNSASGNVVIASPGESTTYTVRGYNGICTGSTSVHVHTVKRPEFEIIAQSNQVCKGATTLLSVKGAESYTWAPVGSFISTGTSTSIIASPIESTNYTIVGSNSSGSVSCYQQLSYSVVVLPEIQAVVSNEAQLCEGERTTLFASGGNSFSWTPSHGLNSTDVPGVVASPSSTTIYTVEVSYNSYCAKTTTVQVLVHPKPTVFAGRDTVYNLNDPIFIEAAGTGTLTWVDGEDIVCRDCQGTQVFPSRSGCYVVEAVNEFGCKAKDDVCIDVTLDFSAYIPNSFSPNGDGINEVFLVYGENISAFSMEIFDRWGKRIFYSEDFFNGWDGYYQGELCPLGVYVYIIKYKGLNGKYYTKTGQVNIIK